MAVTRLEMGNRILREAGVLAYGQTATSDLSNAALSAYDEIYAYLEELDSVEWSSTGSVPDQFVPWVVAMAAFSRATEWGVSNDRYARIREKAGSAEREIRRAMNPLNSSTEIKVSNF